MATIPGAEERAAALVKNVGGQPVNCKGCSQLIYWIRHANGAKAPYDANGCNHFITCPRRADFKR